jgi:AraC-like DNA-binding protein
VVLAIILLVYAIYSLDVGELIYEYALDVIIIVLVCYLLWRVETLSDLTSLQPQIDLSLSIRNNIGPLLKKHCEDTQLYLQYDISLSQLATLIGINRSYLSKHFAKQGITYNAYINGLRIQHFINLYHESAATHQPVSAQQLAYQSGFRNYKTFNAAFKKIMEMTATEWMQQVKS